MIRAHFPCAPLPMNEAIQLLRDAFTNRFRPTARNPSNGNTNGRARIAKAMNRCKERDFLEHCIESTGRYKAAYQPKGTLYKRA